MARTISERKWFWLAVSSVAACIGVAAVAAWWVDPYFHYRAPNTERFRYALDNQRCQNDGIVRHFDYRALVTGSSMVENTRASDVERLWGLKTVKVAFSGASYRELCRLVCTANACNTNIELVIVGLDMNKLFYGKDWMRTDLGTFPDYLYDDDPFNDICYLLNADAIGKALNAMFHFGHGGITSFDEYSRWHDASTRYGRAAVLGGERYVSPLSSAPRPYTAADREIVQENFDANIRPMIESSRNICFFLTPYSMARFYHWAIGGEIGERYPAAVLQFVESVLAYPNARMFFFGDKMDLVSNLENYRDQDHYGPWVNTQILEWMRSGEGELTPENCRERMKRLGETYRAFDFRSLFGEAAK